MRVPGSWRNAGWPGSFYGVVAAGGAPIWKGFTKDNQVNAGWYQRPIRIPANWAGKRVLLDLARVSTDATVFLDGRQAGQVGWPTGKVDLSALVKPGTEQSLRVLVLSTAGVKEFAQFMGTATEQVTKTKAETNARGLIGDVTLTALAQGPMISELFVKPTVVPRTRMDLEVTIADVRSAGPATLVATLIDRSGGLVKTYEAQVSLVASDRQTVQAGWEVDGVQLWDLGKPNLYHVEVALRGGGVQDSASERFGFRQFRIEGRKLYLNASEIRLRTALPDGSMHTENQVRESIARGREFGYNFYELWPGGIQRRGEDDYQEVVSRIADEEGFLISGILPHMGDSISGAGFDSTAYAAQLAAFRRMRNHPAVMNTLPITFTAPAATARGEVTIVLDATIGGHAHRDAFTVRVYPAAPRASGAVLTLDPAGATTRALQEQGFTVAAWDGKPAAGRVVVVGRHALAKPEARACDLAAHVAAGGRLIVMTQERSWYEQDQGLRTSAWSSRTVFPVPSMAAHPILAGLQAADLRDWNGAGSGIPAKPTPLYEKTSHGYPRHGWKWGNSGTVAGFAIEKPHHGAWRPLLQCEFDLAFSPLMELPCGPGLLLWCTLDLEERSRPDPAAALILCRLVEHAASYAGEVPRREAAVLGDAATVADLGLISTPAKALPADLRPIVLASDAAVSDSDLAAWLARGGRALILVDATHTRLGFTTGVAERHLGSLTMPTWPEARGLAASDLRLRNEAAVPVLQTAPQGGELGADGLLGRLAVGSGVAILTTIDPARLPVAEKPWFHYSQWRWTRALAQVAGNVGIAARGDGKALLSDLGRDAPRRLAGSWLMRTERPLAPSDKPWQDTPSFDVRMATTDTADWFPIPVPGAWESSVSQFDGAIWVRKHVDIPADWVGQKLVLDLGPIDDHDQVWFQGVKVGGMGKENPDAWQTSRSYSVKPEQVQAGPAVIAIRVFDWFGGGGFSAKTPADMRLRRSDKQGTPIILGGMWQARIERAVPPAKSPGELVDTGIDAASATWHEPGTDDRAWQTITLPRLFEEAFADIDGAVWFRRTVAVPAHWLERDLELSLGRIGNDDVAYVDGVEIGRSSGSGNRVYRVPAALVKSATLAIAVRVFNSQGPGGFLGWNDSLSLALPGNIAGAAWYEYGYRTDFSTGDDPFRYYRW